MTVVNKVAARIFNVLADTLIAWVLLSLLPVGGILLAITGFVDDRPRMAVGVISFLWLVTIAIGAVFFRWFRDKRRNRVRYLASEWVSSDIPVYAWADDPNRDSHAQNTAAGVVALLLHNLCTLLADRVNVADKAAALLVLETRRNDSKFSLKWHCNHNDSTGIDIKNHLSKKNSFAGRALGSGHVIVLEDSQNAKNDDGWVPTANPSKYRGRAAAPVRGKTRDGKMIDIGVLCFDIAKPHELDDEDKALLQAFADKIAIVWVLMMEAPTIRAKRRNSNSV